MKNQRKIRKILEKAKKAKPIAPTTIDNKQYYIVPIVLKEMSK